MAIHATRKNVPLRSLRLSLSDVVRIFDRLKKCVEEQAEIEMQNIQRPDDISDEDFEELKKNIRNSAFRITITINGKSGEEVHDDKAEIFHSNLIPDRVSSIYMTNTTAYLPYNNGNNPHNMFELFLDFSKPPLLDGKTPLSMTTPNESNLHITGFRDSWASSVHDAIFSTLKERKTVRRWLHAPFSYDVGLLAAGYPLALYLSWRVSPLIDLYFSPLHPLLVAASYVYVFLVSLWGFRIAFGYAKWGFPVIELSDNHDKAAIHRRILGAIVLSLIGSLVWEYLPFNLFSEPTRYTG